MNKIFTCLISSLIVFTGIAQESIHQILPDASCPAIEFIGEPELYIGDDLFNLINGGAELYHELGFAEVLAVETSLSEDVLVKVEIYDMGSPEGAWGIYSMTVTSDSKQFLIGDSGRSGRGFSQFIKGKYMVYLYYKDVEDGELQSLAGCISDNIMLSSEPPSLMNVVDVREEKADKIVYFTGNLGLSSIYSFHYKDVFGYAEGAASIYPDLKIFVLHYEDEGSCIDHFNETKDFFSESSKYHDQSTLRGSYHMKDRKEQQIDIYVENTFLVIFIYNGEMELNELRQKIVKKMGDGL